VQELFSFDLASAVTVDEWAFAVRCFQKRHLLAHRMGVVDQSYLDQANDPYAVLGRKVAVTADEVRQLAGIVLRLGENLADHIVSLP
jgi:hypothetical protein